MVRTGQPKLTDRERQNTQENDKKRNRSELVEKMIKKAKMSKNTDDKNTVDRI